MVLKLLISCVIGTLLFAPARVRADMDLGSAGNFAVLAGSGVTNTGLSVVDGGNIGVSLGLSITGFPQGILRSPYSFHTSNLATLQARQDLMTAYGLAEGLTPTRDLSGQDLGGMTLTPGIYFFGSSAQLTGTLTLDNQGDPNAQFVFQVGSTFTEAVGSKVMTINGGPPSGSHVFWKVGSSATLGTNSTFEGHLLALTSITLNSGAEVSGGSLLAINGAVTLNSNLITNVSSVPEPSTILMVLIGGLMLGASPLRKTRK